MEDNYETMTSLGYQIPEEHLSSLFKEHPSCDVHRDESDHRKILENDPIIPAVVESNNLQSDYTTSQQSDSGVMKLKCTESVKNFTDQFIPTNYEWGDTNTIPAASTEYENSSNKCTDCGKEFPVKKRLTRHQKIHTGEKPFICADCGKKFSSRSGLNKHGRIHTKEQPVTCADCGKSFRDVFSLSRHQRTHTGEYTCTDCGKGFSNGSDLNTHKRVHTGEKPFTCTQCGKSFTTRSNVIKHQSVHTKEKPFMCTECDKSFKARSSLYRHQEIHIQELSWDLKYQLSNTFKII